AATHERVPLRAQAEPLPGPRPCGDHREPLGSLPARGPPASGLREEGGRRCGGGTILRRTAPGPEPDPARVAPPPRRSALRPPRDDLRSAQSEATRLLLDRFAPAGVVIDEDLQIVHFRGSTGPYLEPAAGDPSLHVFKMAREGLLHGLRSVFNEARLTGRVAR